MTKIPKPAAAKAASLVDEARLWAELEESVYLAITCMRLLAELAAREIERDPADGNADALVIGLLVFSDDTTRRLRDALRAILPAVSGDPRRSNP